MAQILKKKSKAKEYGIKNCFVKLRAINQSEFENNTNSDIIITKHFDVKIRDNSIRIGDKDFYSKTQSTFALKLKKRSMDVVLELDDSSLSDSSEETKKRNNASSKMVSALNTVKCKVETKTSTNTSKQMVKSLNEIIVETWRRIKSNFKASEQTVQIGDLMMAKMSMGGTSRWFYKK